MQNRYIITDKKDLKMLKAGKRLEHTEGENIGSLVT
jgi:hypothetical protein